MKEERSFLGIPIYSGVEQPEPHTLEPIAESSSATKFVVKLGLLVLLICPAILLVGIVLWQFMPNCKGGSNAFGGCVLLGVNLNWYFDLFATAFVGAFFLVPLGILILVVGAVLFIKGLPQKGGQT